MTGRQSARECPRGSPVASTRKSAANADAAPGGADRADAVEHVERDHRGELARDRRHDDEAGRGIDHGRPAERVGATASVVIGACSVSPDTTTLAACPPWVDRRRRTRRTVVPAARETSATSRSTRGGGADGARIRACRTTGARTPGATEPAVHVEQRPAVHARLRGDRRTARRARQCDGRRGLRRARCGRGQRLVDLSDCTFLDSTVIGVLFVRSTRSSRDGCRLEVLVPAGRAGSPARWSWCACTR